MSRGYDDRDDDDRDDDDRDDDEGGREPSRDESGGANRALLPGIFTIITGVVNIIVAIICILTGLVYWNMSDADIQKIVIAEMSPDQRAQLDQLHWGPTELRNIYKSMGVGGGVWLLCGVISIIGGVCMCARKARGLAIFSALITAIPCATSPCCLFGLPVGIWSLIVLFQPDVKAAFR